MKIEIPFQGHKNILSLHQKTLEITKDDELTSNGDCIVGVSANISCVDLPEKMKKKRRKRRKKIAVDPSPIREQNWKDKKPYKYF